MLLFLRRMIVGLGLLASLVVGTNPLAADQVPAERKESQAILGADAAQKLVREREAEVVTLLKNINAHITAIKPGSFFSVDREKMAVDDFKRLIPLLKTEATWLLEKETEFTQSLLAYKGALEAAPAKFRQAAEVYAGYEKQEKEPFFSSEYQEMTRRALELAKAFEKRVKLVESSQAEVQQRLKFVSRSVVFLTRLEKFLSIYEEAGPSDEVVRYLKQLNKYIGHFEESLKSFKNLSDKMMDKSPPASQHPKGRVVPGRISEAPKTQGVAPLAARQREVICVGKIQLTFLPC